MVRRFIETGHCSPAERSFPPRKCCSSRRIMTTTNTQLNKYSSRITQPASQGASQAMLIATGLSLEDLKKPQIGIGAVWYDGNPCNMHLADLGTHVKKAADQIGMVGMRFNT